jgi:hypothetical protein
MQEFHTQRISQFVCTTFFVQCFNVHKLQEFNDFEMNIIIRFCSSFCCFSSFIYGTCRCMLVSSAHVLSSIQVVSIFFYHRTRETETCKLLTKNFLLLKILISKDCFSNEKTMLLTLRLGHILTVYHIRSVWTD